MSIFSKILNFKKKLETPFETLNNIYISKEAILNNIRIFQEINPWNSIFPVLKSNAYWHWIKQVAKILSEIKLDYIVADSYFEALKINEVNRTKVLLIWYTLPSNLSNMDFNIVSLVVYDIDTLNELVRIWRKVHIHLKIDSWMHRQWIYFEDIQKYLDIIKASWNIILEWVCTHFADADNIDNSYSELQLENFQKSVVYIKSKWFKLKYIHSNNSAWWAKDFCNPTCNAMRLGISLYWVNPLEKEDKFYNKLNSLKLALRFESTIILTKILKTWDKVSYNWTYIASKDMRIAIVPVGYYEALSRKLSNNYFYTFKWQKLPIIWRICMNLTVIDISWVDIKTWYKIEIISTIEENNIYELAKRSETITYECFTRLAESIRRNIVE